MGLPTYQVQIEFNRGAASQPAMIGYSRLGLSSLGSDGSDNIDWTTITGVQEIHTRMGRQDELDKIEPGTLRLVLNNDDGRYSPENAQQNAAAVAALLGASDDGFSLLPRRHIRVIATHNAVNYPLFYGLVRRWKPSIVPGDQRMLIEAADPSLQLARKKLNESVAEDRVDLRMDLLLNRIGHPKGAFRDHDVSVLTVAARTLTNVQAIGHWEDILKVEAGVGYFDGAGTSVFHSRAARSTDSVSTTVQATFGGQSGLPYRDPDYEFGDDLIENSVRITRTGGTEQVATDPTSIAEFQESEFSMTSPDFVADSAALTYAQWRLAQRRNPVPRLKSIVLEGGGDDPLWVQILARKLSHRVRVIHQFPGNTGLDRDFWIEGIEQHITDGLNRHEVRWMLSRSITSQFDTGDAVLGYSRLGIGELG